MVNILVHSVYSPAESTDEDDYESTDSEQSEVLDEKDSPHGRQSFLRKWRSSISTDTKSLSKKLIKSFVAVSKIKRNGKNESARMEKLLREMGKEKPIRFSLKQLESFTQNFSSRIGVGGFGSTYKGKLPNGVPVAIKRRHSSSSGDDEFITEVSILGRTYHRYILRLIGFCAEANVRALVYEYMENGSLDQILFCSNNDHGLGVVDWEKLYHIAIEVANGITYLHQGCPEMIVHYDIKPANILLDAKFSAKIADFGLAEICERGISHDKSLKGTCGYLAPELAIRGEGSSRCDVFSFGMMLFEIVRRRRNRMDRDWFPQQVWDEFEKGELDKFLVEHDIEDKYKEQAKRMCIAALWCVQFTPENRPCMSTVVNILKGEIEATIPPNPFQHSSFTELHSSTGTSSSSDSTRSGEIMDTSSQSFTSITDNYVVEMASSSENSIMVA